MNHHVRRGFHFGQIGLLLGNSIEQLSVLEFICADGRIQYHRFYIFAHSGNSKRHAAAKALALKRLWRDKFHPPLHETRSSVR